MDMSKNSLLMNVIYCDVNDDACESKTSETSTRHMHTEARNHQNNHAMMNYDYSQSTRSRQIHSNTNIHLKGHGHSNNNHHMNMSRKEHVHDIPTQSIDDHSRHQLHMKFNKEICVVTVFGSTRKYELYEVMK